MNIKPGFDMVFSFTDMNLRKLPELFEFIFPSSLPSYRTHYLSTLKNEQLIVEKFDYTFYAQACILLPAVMDEFHVKPTLF